MICGLSLLLVLYYAQPRSQGSLLLVPTRRSGGRVGENPGNEVVLCSERFFSGYSGFPLSSKTNISKFQFDPDAGPP